MNLLTLRRCLTLVLIPSALAGAAQAPPMPWEPIAGGRRAAVQVATSGRAGFTSMPAVATGLRFTNELAAERHLTNQILLNGSGVACGDVDGDGWTDLYVCGLDRDNALYRNLSDWRFEDITVRAGVSCPQIDATGAAFAELDGDGDLDLIVNSVGSGTHVFLNDGKGRFTELTAPLNPGRCGSSLALADIDGDGDLDLYVANYRTVTIRDQPNTRFKISTTDGQPRVVSIDGRPLTDPDLTNRFSFRITGGEGGGNFSYDENGEPDALFLNDGAGHFTPVSWTGGAFLDEQGRPLAAPPFDWGLSAMFRDVNGDGAPDLYVCNDFKSTDRFWINDGRGHFRAAPALALRQVSLSSMGVDFADLNRDGLDDFLVVDMLSRDHRHRFTQRMDIKPEPLAIGAIANRPQYPRNSLFLNRGDGTWAEVAHLAGLAATEWSWTPIFLDVDLDGYEDLLVSNGFERDGMNVDTLMRLEKLKKEQKLPSLEQLRLRRLFPRLDTPNLAFRNRGDLTFEEVSAAWGFNDPGVSQGMALADFDHDGDLDVVVNNLNGALALYRNDSPAPRVAVRLKGASPNTRGIGAKIKVLGGPVPQSQEMICGGRYLSSDEPLRVFAAGTLTNRLTIEVTWRSGRRTVLTNAAPNQLYEVDEAAAQPFSAPAAPATATLFADVSHLLNHVHHDEPFDDFSLQPTLPQRLSQAGPGVAWFDVDGDGWDDLLIGSGKGGSLALYHNDANGGFSRVDGAPVQEPAPRDQTTILGWRSPDGHPVLLVGSASCEDAATNLPPVLQLDLSTGAAVALLAGHVSSPGPLALADVDGDGRLDLFVGGRVVPNRWPQAASSLLFLGSTNGLVADPENTKALANIGLVSAAVFSDVDGDSLPELILACEWGPLKIFRNTRGRLIPWNAPVSSLNPKLSLLSELTGLWTGVTTGDFDGDGRLDIAAANAGRNTRYEACRARPVRLYYGELFPDGIMQAIEGSEEPGTGRLLPMQPFHLMGLAMPALRERLGTFEAYASRTLPEIYGEAWKSVKELPAVWLESTVFLNRGDHFEARALSLEAQLAPAFAVCAADFDGDGRDDLFLSQNFFAVHPDTARLDAGRSLLLRGDGQGGFTSVRGQESGLLVYGEQRGAAACDYDSDGRVDLVVSQNGAESKLYHNTGAKPGLRVRLAGPPGNPNGIGAVLRAGSGGKLGPAREIHAGSGYWSQDSAVQVVCGSAPLEKIEIRWPGGRVTSSAVPAGARELTVDSLGAILSSK